VARREPEVKELLDRFVTVRAVQMNSLDLARFRFDPNLTWAVLFVNADGTVYGRYGARGRADGSEDVSIEGFRKAAEGALELHAGYPANRASLAAKTGPAPRFPTPRDYPSLREYPARVDPAAGERDNPTCIHCHQVQTAEYRSFRDAGKPVPDEVLWSWPLPDALGLSLDVKERATVKSVAAGSSAARDGFRPGDALVSLDGQPLLSIADVVWVLEHAKDGARLRTEIRREGRAEALALSLPAGWRRNGDFSWRPALEEGFRPPFEVEGQRIARSARPELRVGDLIVEVDGRKTGLETPSRLLAWLLQEKRRGDKVRLVVRRGDREEAVELPAP